MKKNICIFIVAIVIVGFFISYSKLKENYEAAEMDKAKETDKKTETESENIYNVIDSTLYDFDRQDLDEMYKNHEFIAIIHIDDISPATTYREKTDEYIMPYTPGTATIVIALKGKFASNQIKFLRLGGIVSYEEYQKSLYPSEREKLSKLLEGKNITHIHSKEKYDIDIEKDKIYLVYMNRNDDFHVENEYTIEAFEYGLREIKTENDSIKDISKISIKNNKTGKYESLEQSVSKEILKNLNVLPNSSII